MDVNRNHFFLTGILLVLLGVQFRMVEGFVLTEKVSKVVVRHKQQQARQFNPMRLFFPARFTRPVIRPPKWIGWALISVGGVLVLQSLAMRKPNG